MAYCWKYYLLRALCSISVFPMVQQQVVQGGQDVWLIAGKNYLLRALRSISVFRMAQQQVISKEGKMFGLLLEILPSKSIAFYFSVPHGATARCTRRASCMAYCWKYYPLKALHTILVFRMAQQQVVQGGQDVWLVTGNITF